MLDVLQCKDGGERGRVHRVFCTGVHFNSLSEGVNRGRGWGVWFMMVTIPQLKVGRRHLWILAVASAEQVMANVLTAVVGAMLPMMKLFYLQSGTAEPSSVVQGCLAAAGLAGIAAGAPIVGAIADRRGNLWLFRLCGVLIMLGGLGAWLLHGSLWLTIGSLFVAGLGIGGGYSLDDVYISELMPAGRRLFMIGVAKTIAAFGIFWGGLLAYAVVHMWPEAVSWRYCASIVAVSGLLITLSRIRWWGSPRWLMLHGRQAEADAAAESFFGPGVRPAPLPTNPPEKLTIRQLLRGKGLWKLILTGFPWALEGVGAYGVGTFMPVLLMALGLHIGAADATGVAHIEHSVLLSALIGFFMTPGFALGLWLMCKMHHTKMLARGFVASFGCIVLLGATYFLHWPAWVGIVSLALYEMIFSAGPALITFVLPAEVYTVPERGTGSGLSASVGKVGAVLGVFFIPVIMKSGGAGAVLLFCALVMLAGAAVTAWSARKVSA